jgi:hypothetical protein
LAAVLHRFARAFVPPAWIAIFALLALHGTTLTPPPLLYFLLLAAAGFAYCLVDCPAALAGLFRRHRLLLGGLTALSLALAVSESVARARGMPLLVPFAPAQIGLALCAAPLAIFLADAARLRALALVFLAVCAWHFVAMPVEAVSGAKLTWHTMSQPLPRPAGPLNFQASGLALQAFLFVGLFAPMLYLAAGPLFEHKLLLRHQAGANAIAALSVAWLIPCISVQSRSLFAGALAASLFYLVASRGSGHARRWLVAAGLGGIALAAYGFLFSANKSGANLRWAYLELYAREALHWPWIAFGHGFSIEPDPAMLIPGLTAITHSHNDVVQMLYTWGLPALLAYIVFWCGLLKLIYSGFVARRKYWPVCALLVAVPSMITDLGFELYEKAAFLVILSGMCMALAPAEAPASRRAPGEPLTPS